MFLELEKNIEYTFKNKKLIENALTHTSFSNENPNTPNNERLEFLGDSVLGFLTANDLYIKNESKPEGDLTRMRSLFVCEANLAKQAEKISLGKYIRLGKGEAVCGGNMRPSILSDAFEAVIAAIFLDGGMQAAERFVTRFVLEQDFFQDIDSKTRLQELVQSKTKCAPIYRLIAENGPEHEKEFVCQVFVLDKCEGEGRGHSKKIAEQAAAREALKGMQYGS